jgi:hypothetical protein
MEKVVLEFKTPKNKTLDYSGVEFELVPFLSFAQQVFLINTYVETYFGDVELGMVGASEFNFMDAEFGLKNYLLQTNTNVDVARINNNIYTDSLLWDRIFGEITNFKDFRKSLDAVVEEVKSRKAIEASVGKVISDLVSKGYELFTKMSDLTPDAIESAKKSGLELLKQVEKSSLLGHDFPGNVGAPEDAPLPDLAKKPRKRVMK